MSEPVRTFVAVFPPPEVRQEVLASARRLLSGYRIRWVRPENVHLTLKFLGDVREERLDSIYAALAEVCPEYAPFDVELIGFGAFPSARRARILWAGVDEGYDRLRSLAADIDAALALLGFESEKRPYTPHLTLGRVRGRPASLDLPPAAEGSGFRARRIELMASTLSPEGSVYRTLKAFALGESS